MFNFTKSNNIEENYKIMVRAVQGLLSSEKDETACLAVIASVIDFFMTDLNWVGFYLMKNGGLVVGPFQGEPPCLRIKLGAGVCGTAAQERKTQLVEDVHKFDGHIACDSKTESEIVVPIYKGTEIYGVLDLDSPVPARFTQLEKAYLEQIADALCAFLTRGV